MDIASYTCNGRDIDADIKMVKHHHELQQPVAMEASNPAVGGTHLEYWSSSKSMRMDTCGSILYSDTIDHMPLPKDNGSLHGDVQSCWRDFTGASRTSSETKPFNGLLDTRLEQTRATIDGKDYHGRILKANDDGQAANEIDNRQGWEEAATSEGEEIHHNDQYDIQKREDLRINTCKADPTIDHELQSGRDLEEGNRTGLEGRRRSHQDIHELDVDLERSKGNDQDHISYGECQKNQSADRGITLLDGCGEFLSSGKDRKLAFTCATCGCHRNFHQRIVMFEEDKDILKAKGDLSKEKRGGNFYMASCNIDRVAHELMVVANGAIALAQESLCNSEGLGQAREFFVAEHNMIAKISLENLDHIAKDSIFLSKMYPQSSTMLSHGLDSLQGITIYTQGPKMQVINSTTKCLTLLQKPSSMSFQKDPKSDGPQEGPSSSADASPIITVEKRAMQSFLAPPSPGLARPFQPLKDSLGLFGMHNYGSAPRKPLERMSQKMKRTRTRISLEQREKLNAFAEKAGWTVVGQRKEAIDAACQYIGIEPKTLKYWIHNSKQKWKRQPSQSDDTSK